MTTTDLLLAIDQGTTSTRAILFDASGGIRHVAQRELRQIYPRPGWVEHDPEEVWQAVAATCREAIAAAPGPIAAIGITNQRETTVLWDRATGRPVHNAIVWQDRRTAEICRRWRDDGLGDVVARRTGLVIDPYFSASKIRWLLDTEPGLAERARNGEIAFGTIDTFLLWRLSGGKTHATDVTNASRTMLYDLNRLDWDDELLGRFGIPRAMLPEVRDTGADYGTPAAEILGRAIPIAGVAGDQQAALIGQGCFRAGMAKSTYGTGAFALLHTGDKPAVSTNRLLTTIAYRLGGETAYALEGAIFVAGAAVQWLRDRLGVVATAAETDALAAGADPAQRVYLVPAFAGLGAPYWEPAARGALFGLTAECGRAEIARAVLEAVGHQTADLIAAMNADGAPPIATLRVDGGMAASGIAMQFLADIVPVAVERPASLETTAWGAAYVAGFVRGICPPPAEMVDGWKAERRFTPAMGSAERTERRTGWQRAVAGILAAAGR
jgi:glycerol kinase